MHTDAKSAVAQFGKSLMEEVRDDACSFMQRVISGEMRDATSQQLSAAYSRLDDQAKQTLRRFIVESIDSCLVRFLNFVDSREIGLWVKTETGETIDVRRSSDGLVGELYGDNGWIRTHSQYRDGIGPTT